MAKPYTEPSIWRVILKLVCPRCGVGKLYSKKFLTMKEYCLECDLCIKDHDSADGPAYISMFIAGAIMVPLVFWAEMAYQPPMWLHAVIWTPISIAVAVGLLFYTKAFFTGIQYGLKKKDSAQEDHT